MDALFLILFSFTAFIISFLFFPVQIKLLQKWQVFDQPIDHKIHEKFTPSMGGVCILLGVMFTLAIALPLQQWASLKYFFVALAIIFTTGLRDDILTLDPWRKLLGQILPVTIVVVFGNLVITSFYDISQLPFPQWLSWIITVFTIIIITNAYNLIDGIDGLAGTVSVVILAFFGLWFFSADQPHLATLAFAFMGSILAFLVFNWQPSQIFMGDTGTLSIGFVLAYLAIRFLNLNFTLTPESEHRFSASISTAICILIVPVFDTLRVIILRLRKGLSPFRADRNHLHHQFLNLGYSHRKTTVIIGGINVFFIALAWILRNQPDQVILPLVLGICLVINQALKVAQRNTQKA